MALSNQVGNAMCRLLSSRLLLSTVSILILATMGTGLMAQPATIVSLGNLAHAVDSLDKTVPFYRDILGLEVRGGAARDPLKAQPAALDADMSRFTATQGAKFRAATFNLPNASFGLELTEFTGVPRKAGVVRIQDPGAAMLLLQVKDMGAAMAKLKQAGAPVITIGGAPVNPTGNDASKMREVIVRDPDGFLVQLAQPDPLPASSASATGNVIGASVSVAIEDTDKSVAFYRQAIGFQNRPSGALGTNKVVADLIGMPGAQWRITHGTIGTLPLDFALIEYRSPDRKPFILGAHNPGSPAFTMTVADIEGAVAGWKAAGGTVFTTGGTPVVRANGAGNVFVRDPNGLLWEFIQRAKQ
jgi:catechol 2,3-dioxygenase-like lactoylglutathione lyase family enzyme